MRKLNLKELLLPTFALCLICFVTAGAMAMVRHYTSEPIAKNQQAEEAAAREMLFPGAAFEEYENYFVAYRDGALAGYLMETQAQGYGGLIKVAVGLDPEGHVRKLQILSAENETPGLGQKITEEKYLGQFAGKQSLEEIDGIAGATLSNRGVVDAVNQAVEIYKSIGGARR